MRCYGEALLSSKTLHILPTIEDAVPSEAAIEHTYNERSVFDSKPAVRRGGPSDIWHEARRRSQDQKIAHLCRDLPEDRMTRLAPSETGLPMHINISVAQPQESPCIKVSKTTKKELPDLKEMFSVSIPADPYIGPVFSECGLISQPDMEKVCRYILVNRETLLIFWYQLDGCDSYMQSLKSIF